MKINKLFLTLLLTSFLVQSQQHIIDINIGYNINDGYIINGWEEAKWKEETNLKYKAKSFLFNNKRKRIGDDIQEYLQYGGKDFTILTFFYENSGKVIAVKESSGVYLPNLYGLKWYSNIRKNKKNLSNNFSDVLEIDDYTSKDKLHRYYSVFIKDENKLKDRVQVFTIKDNLVIKEFYYAKSNYSSVSWVSNPYQKFSLKDKFDSAFNREKILKICLDALGKLDRGTELCDCAVSKIPKSFEGDASEEFMKYIGDCGDELSSNKIVNKNTIKPNTTNKDKNLAKENVFYQAIVNLNLRTKPSVNSKVLIMVPNSHKILSKEEFTDFTETYSINNIDITAKWVKVLYNNFEGWLFLGGLIKLNNNNLKYLILSNKVGSFILGEKLNEVSEMDFRYKKVNKKEEGFNNQIPIVDVFIDGIKSLTIEYKYNYEENIYDMSQIGTIEIFSNRFKTLNEIGVDSSIEEFLNAYPDAEIVYYVEMDKFYIKTKSIDVSFVLKKDDFAGKINWSKQKSHLLAKLKLSDFNIRSKIQSIKIK